MNRYPGAPDGLGVSDDDRESELNADLTRTVCCHAAETSWLESPAEGVSRLRLELIGTGRPRLTTLVRFAPGSVFPPHVHDGGEEFLVLDGTFSDARGDYPAGSYVRNPPGTHHAPGSRDGCVLFVKLRQFAPSDDEERVVRPEERDWHDPGSGIRYCPLHVFGNEKVGLVAWDETVPWQPDPAESGFELLVLDGTMRSERLVLSQWDWLRRPAVTVAPVMGDAGTLAWVKTGHF